MKHVFVLDENIVIAAVTLENERGDRDISCNQLVGEILEKCHRIAWSHSVHARWSGHLQRLRTQGKALAHSVLTLLSELDWNTEKCAIPSEGDPPALAEEMSWSTKLEDDRDFVRLAAYLRCFLATADNPLREEVAELGLDRTYSFRVLSPSEALVYAQEAAE